MPLFPQVASGAVSQFPIRATPRYLTRRNVMADGTLFRYADMANPLGQFEVNFAALPDADINSLITFFQGRRGKYNRFTFLDPLRNLLKWSEDFTQAAWSSSGAPTITSGQADPLGGTGAQLVTAGAGGASIWQDIAAGPESQYFTGSIWLKQSTPAVSVTIRVEDAAGQQGDFVVTPPAAWQRFWSTKQFASSAASLTRLTIIFPASASVYTFGGQLAYLPGPGGYTKTKGTAGVHLTCRFEEDALPHRVEDFGVNNLARLTVREIS